MAIIQSRNISKVFEYYKKEEGIKNSVRNLFHRTKLEKEALKNMDFQIEQGEIVGLLGPNGAGKTTTIKLLSGIIFPTNGTMQVMGFTPWDRKNIFKKQIAVVMAQKNQLWWDLPANESILLNGYIYELSREEYQKNLDELVDMFGVRNLLPVQVRRLSLGERMKFEIISSLIHKPKIIFLDEPTIGLDLIAQRDMRNFIRTYNQQNNATIILTSHYMEDIEQLCKRTIIINHGEKVYDGLLADMKDHSNKILSFHPQEKVIDYESLKKWGNIKKIENEKVFLEVRKQKVKYCLQEIIEKYDIMDFSVEEVPIEDNIVSIYKQEKGGA